MWNINKVLGCTVIVILLGACSFAGNNQAPVEDIESKSRITTSKSISKKGKRLPLNARFAGKPGYYKVVSGDTLSAIARVHRQKVSDLAAWNGLSNRNLIHVGDILRVSPPGAVSRGIRSVGKRVTVESKSAIALPQPPATATTAVNTATTAVKTATDPKTPQATGIPETAKTAATDVATMWGWPATGNIVQVFDETKAGAGTNHIRGVNIENTLGTPVFAAADGVVAVTGPQRGYGNLIVIKHGDAFISAYAYNQVVLVKEGESVKRGQKIATMGSEDTDRPQLHFQIRKNGKPVDPLLYLPRR